MLCGAASACNLSLHPHRTGALAIDISRRRCGPPPTARTMQFRLSRRALRWARTRPALIGGTTLVAIAIAADFATVRITGDTDVSAERGVMSAIAADWRGMSTLAGQRSRPCDSVVVAMPTASCGKPRPATPDRLLKYAELASRTARSNHGMPVAQTLRLLALLDVAADPTGAAALSRAAATIDDAAELPDASVDVLVDYSAIHLQRFAVTHDVRDLILALDGATRAQVREPSRVEASWNRAVALSWAGMRGTARREWQHYNELVRDGSGQQFPRLVDEAGDSSPVLIALSGRAREATREYAWTVAVPRLSRVLLGAGRDSVPSAVALVDTLAKLSGRADVDTDIDALQSQFMTAARRSDTSRVKTLDTVLTRYLWVRSAAGRQVPEAALTVLDSLLNVANLPHSLRRWLMLERANVLLIVGRTEAALQLFGTLATSEVSAGSLYRVRAEWGAAMSVASLGRTAESVARLADIEERCTRLSYEDCRVGTAAMSAMYLAMLGDIKGTEASAGRVVFALANAPLTQWHWTSAFLLRQVAELNHAPLAANAFDDEAFVLATRLDRADLATAVTIERARSAIEQKDSVKAATILRELRNQWMPRQSEEDQAWSRVNLMLFDAQQIRRSHPDASVALLDSAMRLTAHEQNDARRTPIRLARAESRLAARDTVKALTELDEVLHRLRDRGSNRLTVFEGARLARILESASQLSASVLRARGDAPGALHALSGVPFLGLRPAACCSDTTMSLAIRVVQDSAWIWSPSGTAGNWSLDVKELPMRQVRAASKFDTTALAGIYDLLPSRIRMGARVRDLCIDALGVAAQIPWSGMHDRQRNQYLIERVRVRLVPDALRGCAAERFAAVNGGVLLVDAAATLGNRALPAASREIATLKQLWGSRAQVIRARAGSHRTLDAMSAAALVHFAGHAVLDRNRPDRSYLFLGEGADSIITGAAITTRRLARAPLVVLGACEVGSGSTGRLGGFDSIAGAFLGAGASYVIAALWPVDDAPTERLMHFLHDALRAGSSPAESLRQAQLKAVRSQDPALNTPRVWAAFQIMGSERGGQ